MSETLNVHPFTNFLVKQMELIYEGYATGEYYAAWKIIRSCLFTLKPIHRKKAEALIARLSYCIESLDRVHGITASDRLEKQLDLAIRLDKDYITQFSDLVWEGGYLTQEAFKQVEPTAGEKVSGEKPQEGIPQILSSRVS